MGEKQTKRCGHCQTEKPVEAFNRSKAAKDGHQPRCRACGQPIQRAYDQKRRAEKKQDKAVGIPSGAQTGEA